MRTISQQTWNAWRSRTKVGDNRPVVRATIQAAQLRLTSYNTDYAPGGDYDGVRRHGGQFASMLFGGNEAIREIPNIRSFSWNRSVDQEVAECTMTILNAGLVGIGVDLGVDTYDLPGALTPRKGVQATAEAAERWGADVDLGWNDTIRPDRLIKTFEGYGMDADVPPALDPHLYQSGCWLVDEVQYSANGDLVIKARDLGRLLLDQIAFPPVLPRDYYPLSWQREHSDLVTGRAPKGGKWSAVYGSTSSSNLAYVGEGIVDVPEYVDSTGTWQGNKSGYAIRGDDRSLFWASTGQTAPTDKVWWQVDLNIPKALSALRIRTRSGPYRIYISVHNGTKWLGSSKIPYAVTTEGVNNGAGIPYIESLMADRDVKFEHVLKRKYPHITKIRLTFTELRASGGRIYPWQAGLRDLRMYTGTYSKMFFGTGQVLKSVGNIRDFSHAVRTVCSWAGFWWPNNASCYQRYSTFGDKVSYSYVGSEIALAVGRTWGSFTATGTAPIADLPADQFDKQPLMQTITVLKEMLGFLFWIDEAGGPQWRLPNMYTFGNWRSRHHLDTGGRYPGRTTDYVSIDENDTLVDYTVRESSRNLREQVGVSDVAGRWGSVVSGYQPPGTPANLRRLSLWSDSNFETNREARVAADLVASRQMFDYRRGKVSIWGCPAIQIDDQVRIFERTTNETFFHYVLGIESNLDMENGTWDYTLETHWLGPSVDDGEWVMNTTYLSQATQDYLSLIGGE